METRQVQNPPQIRNPKKTPGEHESYKDKNPEKSAEGDNEETDQNTPGEHSPYTDVNNDPVLSYQPANDTSPVVGPVAPVQQAPLLPAAPAAPSAGTGGGGGLASPLSGAGSLFKPPSPGSLNPGCLCR